MVRLWGGGGSPIGFRIYPTSSSAAGGYIIWTGVYFNSGIYDTTTGIWTIADAGTYLMHVQIVNRVATGPAGYINSSIYRTRGGVLSDEVRILKNFSTISETTRITNSEGLCLVECLVGDTFRFYLSGTSGFTSGTLLSAARYDTQINVLKVA